MFTHFIFLIRFWIVTSFGLASPTNFNSDNRFIMKITEFFKKVVAAAAVVVVAAAVVKWKFKIVKYLSDETV